MIITTIRFRQGTAAEAAAHNHLLELGEPGFESDTGKLKIGDGVRPWNALPYVATPIGPAEGTLVDAPTITWDLAAAPNASVVLGGNRTLATPTNMQAGLSHTIQLLQDPTGGRILTFSAGYKFPSGMTFPSPPTASQLDVYTFYCDGTSMIFQSRGVNVV